MVQMTTHHSSICPPPLPPSPVPLFLLSALPTLSFFILLFSSLPFAPTLIGVPSLLSPPPPASDADHSLPSLASEAAHGFPSRLQSPHRIRLRLRPSPLPLAHFQSSRPLSHAHLLLQASALRLEHQGLHSLPLRLRRHPQTPLLPR